MGVRVGHAQRVGDGWLTGVTVVVPPLGSIAAVDVRGSAPGTTETDALGVGAAAARPDAIVLTGGSAYGLAATAGVVRWCEEQGRGHRVGADPRHVVPVVPGAAIFDLGRGGDFGARPTPELGYEAAVAAAGSELGVAPDRGNVGAGTGATVANERFKGGVGTASTSLRWEGGSVTVGALVVVNAFGMVTQGPHGALREDARLGTTAIDDLQLGGGRLTATADAPTSAALNTTLVVVATDALLDHGQIARLATASHSGLARVIDPVHTLADGDTVFAFSTGAIRLPGDVGSPFDVRGCRDAVLSIHAAAAQVVAAAVLDAVRAASPVHNGAISLPTVPLATA